MRGSSMSDEGMPWTENVETAGLNRQVTMPYDAEAVFDQHREEQAHEGAEDVLQTGRTVRRKRTNLGNAV